MPCLRMSRMLLKCRLPRICPLVTRLTTYVVLAVLFLLAVYTTFDYYGRQVSELFHLKPALFQPQNQQTNLIPSMVAKNYKTSIDNAKVSKLRIQTSNKHIRIKHRSQRGRNNQQTRIRQIEPASEFVNITGRIQVDTCNSIGTDRSEEKCIRIHYYNPPEWITANVLDQCKHRCFITSGSNYQSAPAVLFHMSSTAKSPPKKTSGQIWIFHSLEAPGNSNTDFRHWKKLFNWTYTYRRDSDILQPFASLHSREVELDVDNYMNSIPLLWQNKSRDAAWFVSHCHVQSNRDMYTKMLSKYINVDVFGKCGNIACPTKEWRDCNIMLNKRYKYYLSFENALCSDYITEKVFNNFVDMSYVLPVIRGRCNLTLYLPTGSYINTNDFKTVSDLADFLKRLTKSQVDKYFSWWKTFYFTRSGTSGICNICNRLHHAEDHQRVYNDVGVWMKGSDLNHDVMCKYPRDLN